MFWFTRKAKALAKLEKRENLASMLAAKGITIADKARPWQSLKWGIEIEPDVVIGSRVSVFQVKHIGSFSYIVSGQIYATRSIGRYCSIAENVMVGPVAHPMSFLSTSPFQYSKGKWPSSETAKRFAERNDKEIKRLNAEKMSSTGHHKTSTIGNDVWIGRDVLIKRGVCIGNGAVVGAGAIVSKDVPPYAVVGGVPAKIIKYRFSVELIDRLERLKWWNYHIDLLDGIPFEKVDLAVQILEDRLKHAEPYRPATIKLSADFVIE